MKSNRSTAWKVLQPFALSLCVLAVPALVSAQSTIAGVVRDTSGAVLPGVTVEASSPVLIERVRTTVSDGSGQYRIVNLQPGTYSITFTLAGFNTVRRDGLELPADFVASVNAELRVGALEETITVTGESPVVDLQSARRQRTMDSELLQSIPTARSYAGLVRLIPSMTGGSNNVVLNHTMIVFGGQGGRGNEGRVQVDGINTGASVNGGGVSGYRQDLENAVEVSISTTGGLGEVEVGGPAINIIPRSGGNTFTGHMLLQGFDQRLTSSNFTERIQQAGLARPNQVNYNYNVSLSSGGPIVRDRLWYFTHWHYTGNSSDISMFHNRNAGDITKWTYEADPSRPARSSANGPWQPNLRLTIQVSPRDRLSLFWDEQISSGAVGQGSASAAPETGGWNRGWQRVQQVKWTSTASNRIMVEAAFGTYLSSWNTRERPNNNRDLIPVTEQCAGFPTANPPIIGCPDNGGIPGLSYRGQATWSADWIGAHTWNSAASYITGSHNMKVGYQGAYHVDDRSPGGQPLLYRVNNGVPNQMTLRIRDFTTRNRVRYHALYAQDQWTRNRLTLSGALRYDHSWSHFPEQTIGGTRFLSDVTVFPGARGVEGYHDITPRMGAVYDVFGTGRTALKFNAGRYLEAAVSNNGNYSVLLPASRIPQSVTRTWTDANGNYHPECDLLNPLSQDLRSTGGDFCGPINNINFGRSTPQVTYDPAIMKGWGVRPADWQIGLTVQHEVLPRVSLEVGYMRRWLQNFTVTDNLLRSAADHDPFSIVAPSDPRLPGGGGYVIDGLFNARPEVANLVDNFNTYAPNYGKQYSIYNGMEINVRARLRNGLQLQAGSSTGQTVTNDCEIREQLPETSPLNPYCHEAPGITTRITGTGSYTIPKIDVLISGAFQSSPGAVLSANYAVPNAVVAQSLGRNLSLNQQFATVNLVRPGEIRGERVNQVDLRVGKRLSLGRQRSTISLDMFNLLNPDHILAYNQTFIPGVTTGPQAWLRPTSLMTARTARITIQHDF